MVVKERRVNHINRIANKTMASLFDVDARGRQLKGWKNKLIWGQEPLGCVS